MGPTLPCVLFLDCPLCHCLPAVLNRDNMVGLLYVHDPNCSPQQHATEAQQLLGAFDQQYPMVVFNLKDKGGVQGDLLTAASDRGSGSGGGDGAGCRLLTFQEYLEQHLAAAGDQQQQQQQQEEGVKQLVTAG